MMKKTPTTPFVHAALCAFGILLGGCACNCPPPSPTASFKEVSAQSFVLTSESNGTVLGRLEAREGEPRFTLNDSEGETLVEFSVTAGSSLTVSPQPRLPRLIMFDQSGQPLFQVGRDARGAWRLALSQPGLDVGAQLEVDGSGVGRLVLEEN